MIVLVYLLNGHSWVLYPLEATFLILAFVQIYLHVKGQRKDVFMKNENGEIGVYWPALTGRRQISIDVRKVLAVDERNFGSVVSFNVHLSGGDVIKLSPERLLWMSYEGRVREDSRAFFRGIFRERYGRDWRWP